MSVKTNFKKFKNTLTALSLFLIFLPSVSFGARLYLEPARGEYRPGDTFLVELKIDNEGECLNAIEANLIFSKDSLQIIDFSQGESILSLWVKSPVIEQAQGLISFIGGVPGGYCGRIAGDPGPSNLLGKIVISVPGTMVSETKEFLAEINFSESSQVLLSDRQGTKAKLSTQGAVYKILNQPGFPQDQWGELIAQDRIAPEKFKIEIEKNPLAFGGQYFIVFSTNDKETGLDYYEVKEGEREWRKAVSPYLLEDQSLKNIIKVRAVDKAGNETISEISPSKKAVPHPAVIFITVLLIFILVISLGFLKRKIKTNK